MYIKYRLLFVAEALLYPETSVCIVLGAVWSTVYSGLLHRDRCR